MWHEARRRQKATQKLLNEHKKRAERRREENRIDPNSLLQIHGLKSRLCLEPGVYKQAVKSLVAWQGDKNITIDRFDIRATISSIPSAKPTSRDITVLDSEEDIFLRKILNYERYRLLIQNDLNRVPEELRLKLVAKSDVASDAKMKKLRNNKFGTSGESFNNAAAVIFNRHMQVRDQTPKKGGATIGYSYNSVPPPACLSEGKSGGMTGSQDNDHDTYRDLGLKIVDEIDNFELDDVILSSFEVKELSEIAKKYGLSGEELTLLARRDKEDVDTTQLLKEIIKLNRNKDKAEKKLKSSTNDQVYGPALPPGLKTNNLNLSSEENDDGDDNISPIQQRSPSGANIPLRNGSDRGLSESSQSDNDSKTTKVSDKRPAPESSNSSPQKPVKPKLTSPSPPEQSSSYAPSDAVAKNKFLAEKPKDLERCIPDRRRQISREQMSPRRAPTPLAYKRNCRSSRSLSRERRYNRYHQSSSHKSSRHSKSYRSRSRSSSSTPSSTSSHSPSLASGSTYSSHSRRRTSSSSFSSEASTKSRKKKNSVHRSRKEVKKRSHRRRR